MTNTKQLLERISDDIKKAKICESLIVFGSYLYDLHPQDIDLILYSSKNISPIEHFKYIKFLEQMDKKYPKIGFAYSSGKPRKKKFDLEVAIVPYYNIFMRYEKDTTYGICESHNVIFGEDPFKIKPKMKAQDYLTGLIMQKNNTVNDNYFKIKSCLRNGVGYKGESTKKNTLIKKFEKHFKYNISQIVKDKISGKIINDDLLAHDLEDIREIVIRTILKENEGIQTTNYPIKYLTLMKISRNLRQMWQNNSPLEKIRNYLLEEEQNFN